MNFVCEKDAQKQQYLLGLDSIKGTNACVFKDLKDLGCAKAECVRHNAQCSVLSCNVWSCGFSCTSFSRANVRSAENRATVGGREGVNVSADTFSWNLKYVAKHRPSIIVNENVEAIDDEATGTGTTVQEHSKSNLALVLEAYASIGYVAFSVLMSSDQFGVPQSRRRFYVIGFPNEDLSVHFPGDPRAVVSEMEARINLMKLEPLGLESFLLEDSDPAVAEELERLQAAKKTQAKRVKSTEWQQKHIEVFSSRGLRWGRVQPSLETEASPWFQALPAREKDIVILAELDGFTTTDLSQSIGRNRGTRGKIVNTLMPGERRWLVKRRRLLVGCEALSLQAVPWQGKSHIRGFTSGLLQSLAGNAFTGTTCMAAFAAAISLAKWS